MGLGQDDDEAEADEAGRDQRLLLDMDPHLLSSDIGPLPGGPGEEQLRLRPGGMKRAGDERWVPRGAGHEPGEPAGGGDGKGGAPSALATAPKLSFAAAGSVAAETAAGATDGTSQKDGAESSSGGSGVLSSAAGEGAMAAGGGSADFKRGRRIRRMLKVCVCFIWASVRVVSAHQGGEGAVEGSV